jgi:hypothetical protein
MRYRLTTARDQDHQTEHRHLAIQQTRQHRSQLRPRLMTRLFILLVIVIQCQLRGPHRSVVDLRSFYATLPGARLDIVLSY